MSSTKPIGLKIKSVRRNWGNPVPMNPASEESVVYLQGDRRRTEWRRKQKSNLWPGGPRVTFYEPRSALIEGCEGTHQTFSLDLDNKTWAPFDKFRKLSASEIERFQNEAHRFSVPAKPTIEQVITTKDTGERKELFGRSARHVTTTHTVTPLERGDARAQETVTDGWYIDLNTRISCDPELPSLNEGTTSMMSSKVGLLVSKEGDVRHGSASPPQLVKMTYVGKPETGFALQVRTTMRRVITGPDKIAREQTNTMETTVTELSSVPIDPRLFEVPRNYKRVARLLPAPRLAAWARWLAWAHTKWSRIRR